MSFYSYQYLVKHNNEPNFLFIIGILVLAAAIFVTSYLYFKNRSDNKYRDLLIIFGLGIFLFIGINYNNYEQQLDINNKTNQTLSLMQSVAKDKKVSKNKLYSNSSSLTEGMLIKAGKDIYRVSFDNNLSSYTLSKANIISSQKIQLIKK
ncbi:DUF3290 domain-containing protein [Companilactobacillus kimchii]|uniref:DUF3290 domain-containing protein n=2 Tax=Companilactobacillus kimchii TaxID=2801452 RepID=A0ABR5NRQ1_9LACO|nr:DUF3290 domain-containing protein [Companilactobacillus kimchii]GEO47540.1 hypothetical protein LKI01_15390 [Companilactobacillus paralimentarius]KAE9559313.1 hypothetical protein ATN91_11770 [Companilactobacillus kimchii]KAE9560836.1 hypothetical protein ATN91_08515 [Companilactobacillus kimchii]KRK50703.1 hypothetical protein FC97_GL001342 [Companilactobacillus kimchii DSM 13961 = JCM 10707]OWF32460.1 hypothetical protein LKACC12383_01981 [Companilactobacillus kimchii]